MEEKKKKKPDAPKRKVDKATLKRMALWKLAAVGATVLMCGILLLYLVVDEPSQAELTIIDYARKNKISALQYPEELVKLLEDNPETKDFVLNYPFREEKPEINLKNYDLKNGMPTLMQWDRRWGYMEYGDGMVCSYGSGPLCLAMAGYYVTERADFYPDRVVKFARDNDFYTPGSGTKWTLISVGGPALGLDVKELAPVEEKVAAYLKAKIPLIAVVSGEDFASDSHFIVLWGYQDGRIKIVDPYSGVNTGREWAFEDLVGQIKNLWVIQEKV